MRRLEAILAAVLVLSLSGCVLRGKDKVASNIPPPPKQAPAPAPPPAPPKLSIPQTNVELPPPQPVNAEALAPPLQEEPPATTPAARPPRRAAPPPARTESAPVVQGPVAPPQAAPPAEQPDRGPVGELLSAQDIKKFQDETAAFRKETQSNLDQAKKRHLTPSERQRRDTIASLLSESVAAEARSDWRSASDFAERALALAKELNGAK
jgi:hypothetical protein